MKKKRHALSLSVTGNTKKILTLCLAFALSAVCQTGLAATGYASIDDIAGVTYSNISTSSGCPTSDAKVYYLYNVGTKKFLSVGGGWGTHSVVSTTPHALWFEKKASNQYYIGNVVSGSSCYLFYDSSNFNIGYLWMGNSYNNSAITTASKSYTYFTFTQSENFSSTNRTYKVSVIYNASKTYYLTALPDNTISGCDATSVSYTKDKYPTTYSNQEWKIIPKSEYLKLLEAEPAAMKDIVDVTYLMKSPDFRMTDTDASSWALSNGDETNVYLGSNTAYCLFSNRGTSSGWDSYKTTYKTLYSKHRLSYLYTRKRGITLYQDVTVTKPGWYIVRCNGFSTLNESTTSPATLVVKQTTGTSYSYKSLNFVNATSAKTMAENNTGTGIGQAFYDGQYVNQVQVCVETGDDKTNAVSASNPATLRIQVMIPSGDDTSDALTAVDNFKIYYAGTRRSAELILDEDLSDLTYITGNTDDYTNSVLNLHRTFNTYKWNALVLPVSLTKEQVKCAFGDSVKVAKLTTLSNSSIQFTTVNPSDDDGTMMEAFEPYIIYPPVMSATQTPYTANGISTKISYDNGYNYVIPMVSLDRTAFSKYVSTSNWKSTNSFSSGSGTMTCYGTMAKTYDDSGILSGRDDLSGDYFFYKGQIIQVPSDKQYGLKAFRFWFDRSGTSKASVAVYIDGVFDSGETAIDAISGEGVFTSRGHGIDGVFDLYGNLVRRGTQTDGLPKGIYITGGRKVVVK